MTGLLRLSLDISKNVTLTHAKQHLKIVSGIIKSHSTRLNIKTTQLSKEFWEIKKRSETPKTTWKIIRMFLHSKQQVLPFMFKWEIWNCHIQRGQPFKQKNWNNQHLQTQKYKLVNYDNIDWPQINAIKYHYNALF